MVFGIIGRSVAHGVLTLTCRTITRLVSRRDPLLYLRVMKVRETGHSIAGANKIATQAPHTRWQAPEKQYAVWEEARILMQECLSSKLYTDKRHHLYTYDHFILYIIPGRASYSRPTPRGSVALKVLGGPS